MLQSIINFDFTASGMGEQTCLETWEALVVLEYEIKAAVLTGRTDQKALAQHLSMNASRLVTYAQVRAEITSFLQAGRQWRSSPFGAVGPAAATQGYSDGAVPMDVDAVYQSANETRDSICHWCGKRGRMKKECWAYTAARQSQGQSTYKGRQRQERQRQGRKRQGSQNKGVQKGKSKGGKVAAVTAEGENNTSNEGADWPAAYAEQWAGSDEQWTAEDTYEEQWVYAVAQEYRSIDSPLGCTTWMVDSGSAVSLIPADGTQQEIPHYGHRMVSILLDGIVVADIKCVVASVRQPILSVTTLTQAGHTVWFDASGGHVRFTSGVKATLLSRQGVYYLAGCSSVPNSDTRCVNTTTLEDGPQPMEVETTPATASETTTPATACESTTPATARETTPATAREGTPVRGSETTYETSCGEAGDDLEDGELVQVPVQVKSPAEPGVKECRLHDFTHTHTPCRSWCRICVANRGRENKHMRMARVKEKENEDEEEEDRGILVAGSKDSD
eukprot:6469095-Amphidinium_carterae.2